MYCYNLYTLYCIRIYIQSDRKWSREEHIDIIVFSLFPIYYVC